MTYDAEAVQPDNLPSTFVMGLSDDADATGPAGPDIEDAEEVAETDPRGPIERLKARLRRSQRKSGLFGMVPYSNDELRTEDDQYDRIEVVRQMVNGHRYYMTDLGVLAAGRRGFAVEQDSNYARELLLHGIKEQGWQSVVISGGSRQYQRQLARYLQQHGIQARLAKDPKPSPSYDAAAPGEAPETIDAEIVDPPAADQATSDHEGADPSRQLTQDTPDEAPSPGAKP